MEFVNCVVTFAVLAFVLSPCQGVRLLGLPFPNDASSLISISYVSSKGYLDCGVKRGQMGNTGPNRVRVTELRVKNYRAKSVPVTWGQSEWLLLDDLPI